MGAIAVAFGGASNVVAGLAVISITPALVGFLILPRLAMTWAPAGLVLVWVASAAWLTSASGGAGSPLTVAFTLAPALVVALNRPWLKEAGAATVLGYALAALVSHGRAPSLGPYPELLSALSLAFVTVLLLPGAAKASREDIVGQRIAEVSHELRTPLTHILGFSEMIERQLFGPVSERYVEYAGLIRKSGGHLLSLVNDLLDLSRLEAGRYDLVLERFDARAIVEEVVRLSTDSALKKSIALGMVTPERPIDVQADERALRRMLINTLGNGIKFTPEGGRVIVAARAENGVLVLETIDNGPGIPEAERDTLGAPYERGSSGARAEGTGLGLALVRALAALHGGGLSFHDAPGGGALVRVTLPVLAER